MIGEEREQDSTSTGCDEKRRMCLIVADRLDSHLASSDFREIEREREYLRCYSKIQRRFRCNGPVLRKGKDSWVKICMGWIVK